MLRFYSLHLNVVQPEKNHEQVDQQFRTIEMTAVSVGMASQHYLLS